MSTSTVSDFMTVTTPSLPGFKVKKVLGVASGLTARTRGIGGKFVAGLQSFGEVSAFTLEMEKARIEALQRLKITPPASEPTPSLESMLKQRKYSKEQCSFQQPVRQ